jgi:ABC-2 type transport system permease protein
VRVGAAARIRALALKDVAELWRNPGAIVPPVAMALGALVPAFLVVVAAPAASGEVLGDSSEFADAARQAVGVIPELAGLDGSALVQAFLFHQFGLLLLLVPVVGAMALAAHAVIGEKTARTLEPLLATPLSTAELLSAKTATPFVFATLLLWGTLLLYLGGIVLVGEPGVWRTFLGTRSLLLFLLLGPLLSLVALLVAVIVSSRVTDARSAQQLGAFVVLPVTIGFVVQLVGGFVIGPRVLMVFALVLIVLVGGLLWLGVIVFGRERILMRWK